MDHDSHETLYQPEQTATAAHMSVDRRVAMTSPIIAPVLAARAMLSHRGHNETMMLQPWANIFHTKASDAWNFYQAKKNRQYLYEALADFALANATVKHAEDS